MAAPSLPPLRRAADSLSPPAREWYDSLHPDVMVDVIETAHSYAAQMHSSLGDALVVVVDVLMAYSTS